MTPQALLDDPDLLLIGPGPPATEVVRRQNLKIRNDLSACHKACPYPPSLRPARRPPPEAYALIDARAQAHLTQEQVASRMATTQAYVAKMEGLKVNPSVATLRRFAKATGTRLKITFEPRKA
ncbi:MAG: helix-turn-helix transcriptional regulator [Rhodospirillaceae bacterium]|nr:helix-turn-helix transcriptional regulator [Rhodospirillaceae bacterium]